MGTELTVCVCSSTAMATINSLLPELLHDIIEFACSWERCRWTSAQSRPSDLALVAKR